jgi:uncharacterized membrane protein YciS (DUF1049 family)
MLWILKLLFGLIVALVVLVLGVEFFFVNSTPVTVNYILSSMQSPLSWVVVWAFTAGAVLTVLIGFFVVMPLRWRIIRLRNTVDSQQQEIGTLLKKSGQDVH